MAQMTFNLDDEMQDLLEELKGQLRVSSKAAVLRQALALLELAVDTEVTGGSLAMIDHDEVVHRIRILLGRSRRVRERSTGREPQDVRESTAQRTGA